MARANLTHISPNQSSRWGIKPRLIVAHDTEGANLPGITDLIILGKWFGGWTKTASCHAGGDAEGGWIRIVPDSRKAWHAGWVNSFSLGYEQIGKATWTTDQWVDYFHLGLYRFASQIATWSMEWDIPLRVARNGREKGVIQHRGVSGSGGHWDCGHNYPLYYVVTWAKLIRERRRIDPNEAKIDELERIVSRIQRKYRGRADTRPW